MNTICRGKRPQRGPVGLIAAMAPMLLACSSSTVPVACSGGDAIELASDNCLVFEDGGALASHRAAIESVTADAVGRIDALMPISGVVLRVRADPAGSIPELGLGGYTPSGREVLLSFDPASPALEASLANDLGPMIAHEMHHARRWQTRGYGSTLLEAVVSEGLADHFSIEVFGIEPPIWATAVQGEALNEALAQAEGSWTTRPYDHATWFFGAGGALPRWAGYSMGFELVGRYLEDDPARVPSRLYDEPADRFRP